MLNPPAPASFVLLIVSLELRIKFCDLYWGVLELSNEWPTTPVLCVC